MSRRQERVMAAQALYAYLVSGTDLPRLLVQIQTTLPEIKADFTQQLLQLVEQHRTDLETAINQHSHNWKFSRLCWVDQSLLLLGAAELLYTTTDKAVIINEYLEIAHYLSTEESYKLINGILNQINGSAAENQ